MGSSSNNTDSQPVEFQLPMKVSLTGLLNSAPEPAALRAEAPEPPSEGALPVERPAADGLPSAGSKLHGALAADGTPACQPCVGVWKVGGCLNGDACSYCHRCPKGELKRRQKMQKERRRAAAAAGEPSASPPSSLEAAGATLGRQRLSKPPGVWAVPPPVWAAPPQAPPNVMPPHLSPGQEALYACPPAGIWAPPGLRRMAN